MEPQTVTGDAYVLSLARYIRSHESVLSGTTSAPAAGPSWLPSLTSTKTRPTAPVRIVPPKPLSISLHHISYVLLRFEALGLPIGRLDEPLPHALRDRRPQSTFSYISASEQRSLAGRATRGASRNPETMSLSSVRSALTRMSIGAASTASWFGGATSTANRPPDPDREVKYLYSAFTKLPAINIIQPELSALIEGFEDAASPTTLTPFDVFKNLHLLSFTDVDPRTVIGWERLSCQLRSLTLIRTGVEDVEELIVGQVVEEIKTRPKLAAAGANGDVDAAQEDNGVSPSSQATPRDSEAGAPAQWASLPSLSWHFLSSLCLPSSSLTFFPSLPLPSLRSLDLSHNLLNSIPPSLADSPLLVSLDLSGNLIEDCRGARDALPSIRTLNLRGNRLEALSGLDYLATLKQVDLRENSVFEASEVGRLAQLPVLEKIWIKENPVMEEYADPRLEVLVEFAKEGWPMEGRGTIVIDGEPAGYWEKGRVAERLPLGMRLAAPGARRKVRTASMSGGHSISSSSRGSRGSTPRAEESVVPWAPSAAHADGTEIMSVKHRGQHGATAASGHKGMAVGESSGGTAKKGKAAEVVVAVAETWKDSDQARPLSNGRSQPRLANEKRRHRRVVALDDDNDGSNGGGGVKAVTKATKPPEELTEAEKLKREVLFGTHDQVVAAGRSPAASVGANQMSLSARPRSPCTRTASPSGTDGQAGKGEADMHRDQTEPTTRIEARQSSESTSQVESSPIGSPIIAVQAVSRPKKRSIKHPSATMDGDAADEGSKANWRRSQVQTAADLRARIEGLKREVGEDWMRVLSRGEAGQ